MKTAICHAIRRFIPFLLLSVSMGCAQQMVAQDQESRGVEHVFDKNYTLGKEARVHVGEAIIKVRDYYVEHVNAPIATAESSFSIQRGLGNPINFAAGTNYHVFGHITRDGVTYDLVEDHPGAAVLLMLRRDGTVHNRVAVRSPQGVTLFDFEWNVSPPNARMSIKSEDRIQATKGYQNYEILYDGISNNAVQFTYREFSPEGIARTAFYQNLSYDAKAEFVRFRKFKIKVNSANSEGIDYAVVEDGAGS